MLRKTLALVSAVAFASVAYAGGTSDHTHDKKFSVGQPSSDKPARIINVSMKDTMRFEFAPSLDTLKDGEVVEFVIRNDGRIAHEFSIGNSDDQVAHAEMMRRMPNMKHKDPNTVAPEPGQTSRIRWKFSGEDTVVFSCNIPCHFEAGMGHSVKIAHGH